MIDVNDIEAKSSVEIRYCHGTLIMFGKPYMSNGKELCTAVVVNDSINEAWTKLVEIENKRTEYIDSILEKAQQKEHHAR